MIDGFRSLATWRGWDFERTTSSISSSESGCWCQQGDTHEIIREEMAFIPEKSPAAMARVLEESPAVIAPKSRPTASKTAHKKSAPA